MGRMETPGHATSPTHNEPGKTSDVASMLEGGAVPPDQPLDSEGPSPGGDLLARLKQEAQAKLQLQRELVELTQQGLDNQFAAADGLALEVEGLKQERCVQAGSFFHPFHGADTGSGLHAVTPTRDMLSQRTDRLVMTLHMLEARNMRLSAESAALQDGIAAMSAAQDTLLQERDSLSAMLSELNRKVGGQASCTRPLNP